MLDWIKRKVVDVFKGKILRLLAEQSTRKAIISLVIGVIGYQWTDGKVDAAATLLGSVYVFLSLVMEDKKPTPVEVKPVPLPERQEAPIDESDSQSYVERKDPHINGQFP